MKPKSELERRLGGRATEPLELVDASGVSVGAATLLECHRAPGKLHRAFSVYLFDGAGRLLVHQRAAAKALWGGHWTNSCCSHPRPGEDPIQAAARRSAEELGTAPGALAQCFEYVYRAAFSEPGCDDIGVEHEFVHVLTGTAEPDTLRPAPEEVDGVRWLSPSEVTSLLAGPEPTTPWFALAWPKLLEHKSR